MPDKLYQHIYLSPHLDDAVLSCGGRIYQERQTGLSVLVLTLMAGDPSFETESSFVNELHARWKLEAAPNPVAARRAEDREALSVLGADGLHWEWPDCIYRCHPATGQFLYDAEARLFGPVHLAETGLVKDLARRLAGLRLAPGGRVYAPLTLGGHVDHLLVRQAAEVWGAPGGELVYYEDYPYAAEPEALASVLGDGVGWRAEIVPLAEQALAAKTAAVVCYRSQLGTFFANKDEMALRLRSYARVAGGGTGWAERYWHNKQKSFIIAVRGRVPLATLRDARQGAACVERVVV